MAKHLHREVILLENFFKSLLKKFFTLCCWHKSTVFKIWKIFIIQLFSFTLTSQHREQLKLLILLGKGSKLKCLLIFSAKSEGWLCKCIKKTSKYFTYSYWSHLQLWVPTAFTNHNAITPRWASKKNQRTILRSLTYAAWMTLRRNTGKKSIRK